LVVENTLKRFVVKVLSATGKWSFKMSPFAQSFSVEKAGYSSLVEGAKISYEVVAGRAGKMSAEKLRLAWSPYFYRCAKPSFARRSRFLRLTGNQNNSRPGL
jgi:hypothetical protein